MFLYNSPAAQSNKNSDNVTNKDSDNLIITQDIDQNLAQFTDASVSKVDYSTLTIPNPLTASNVGDRMTEIKAYLARPVLCPSTPTAWTTAVARGTIIMSMDVPSPLLNTTMYKEKVSGFYGFKGNLVLKFQTNAQKFQQGMILISVLPCGPMLTSERRMFILNHIEPLSQLPSIRHDISQTNETIIKVPYMSPMLMHPLDSARAKDYATVYYIVYSPLSSGNINYRCWCHFEDVELSYPMAQSGKGMSVTKKANKYTTSDLEDTSGIVSTPIATIASGVRQLGDNIPIISSFSQPTAWFLDSLSKGFASFGLSNPVDTSVRHSVVPRIGSHTYNVDINDTVESFGYLAGNKIAHLPGFAGTDVDEMSIQHLCSIPSFLGYFVWSTADGPSAEIFSRVVGKSGFSTAGAITTGAGTRNYKIYPPFAYIANRFVFWRGSIKYKFYAVKTNFHNGRILFSYSPNLNPTNNTSAKADFNTRYIWDISQVSTFEVTIPYVSPQSWTLWNSDQNIGSLKGFVLTELEAVSGVSTTIEILVEISAGPDFEVAQIDTSSLSKQCAIIQSPTLEIEVNRLNYNKYKQLKINQDGAPLACAQSKHKTSSKNNRVYYYRSRKQERDKIIQQARTNKVMAQGPQLDMGGFDDDTDLSINQNQIDTAGYNCLYTMGESVKSLRTVLKRSNAIWIGDTANTGTYRFYTDVRQPCYPVLTALSAELLPPTRLITDDYAYFAGIFAMYRGGVVYRAIPHSSAGVRLRTIVLTTAGDVTGPGVATTDLTWGPSIQPAQVYSNSNIQGAIDVHIPYYSPTHTSVYTHFPGSSVTYSSGNPFSYGNDSITIMGKSATANTSSFDVTRQIADDFSMGCFIGTLPVLDASIYSSSITLP